MAIKELSIDVVVIYIALFVFFCYVCVREFMCKNRQSDQMIFVEMPTCFASSALFSF
jgi:hypothetical protein